MTNAPREDNGIGKGRDTGRDTGHGKGRDASVDTAIEAGASSARGGDVVAGGVIAGGAGSGGVGDYAAIATRRARALVTREAITLPLIFLTVILTGGLRVVAATHQLRFLPPSLMALVLSLLLMGALVRCGALAPARLVDPARPALANASGMVVLITLFLATAQTFNMTTPDAGLLQFLFNVFYLFLLWNTMAARPDRRRLLSSLLVVFGGAFILRFVVLAALYDPQGGLTKRVLTAMLEGVTLGSLAYEAPDTVTGYVAFFTVLLFLIGLALLPAAEAELDSMTGPGPASSAETRYTRYRLPE